jgi:anti-sigma B factor antagonist
MEISARQEGPLKIVSLSGILDTGQVSLFRERFLDETAGDKLVVLECTGLEYLDSSGLAAFVNIFKNLNERQDKLVICGLSETILRVVRFTKLDRVFTLATDLEEAKANITS